MLDDDSSKVSELNVMHVTFSAFFGGGGGIVFVFFAFFVFMLLNKFTKSKIV